MYLALVDIGTPGKYGILNENVTGRQHLVIKLSPLLLINQKQNLHVDCKNTLVYMQCYRIIASYI